MKKMFRRLRMREGDVLLVRDEETMKQLTRKPIPKGLNIPNCPIIFCPGSVHRLSKEYLLKLVERAS